MTIAVCIITDWVGCFVGIPRIARLPYAGWLLELAGVATTVLGFARRIDLFGGDSISSRIARWARSCPLFKQHHRLIAGAGNATLSGLRADLKVTHNFPENADLDARVSRLERMMSEVNDGFQRLREKTEADIDTIRTDLRAKLDSVEKDIATVKKQTTEAHIGGIGIELAGVGWIFAGLTLSTAPELVIWLFDPLISLVELPAITCAT